ncbi:subtilisin-like protease SBT4.3 [Bidens hawaiensis]|uniref:subtilisin-like protease SBT4.3 n=1 Tax=Bidens hawaiensis TaxID=980011 RepID=UPI00404A484B
MDILSAFAPDDGVDIISISIGFPVSVELTHEPIAMGSFHALEKGVLMVNSAGNEGPSLYSLINSALWVLTVGASDTNRSIVGRLLLGTGEVLGHAINPFPSSDTPVRLIYGKERTRNCSESEARNCLSQCLESSLVKNKVILCDSNNDLEADVVAPCVELLAAFSQKGSPSDLAWDKNSANFSIMFGTSMACPHVAVAAAYVKSFHHDWSPSAITSALMTTAWEVSASFYPEGEFAYGSKHIAPLHVTRPGLVYEASADDYLRLYNKNGFGVSFSMTVTNVGHANSTYASYIEGDRSSLDIRVEPTTLHFKALKQKKFVAKSLRIDVDNVDEDSRYVSTVFSDDVSVQESLLKRGSVKLCNDHRNVEKLVEFERLALNENLEQWESWN